MARVDSGACHFLFPAYAGMDVQQRDTGECACGRLGRSEIEVADDDGDALVLGERALELREEGR